MLLCLFTGDVNLDYLAKVAFYRFLHCKVIIFPFLINKYYLRGVHYLSKNHLISNLGN